MYIENRRSVGCINMYSWEGKHFSIMDPNNISTVVYQINETLRRFKKFTKIYCNKTGLYRRNIWGQKEKDFLCRRPI